MAQLDYDKFRTEKVSLGDHLKIKFMYLYEHEQLGTTFRKGSKQITSFGFEELHDNLQELTEHVISVDVLKYEGVENTIVINGYDISGKATNIDEGKAKIVIHYEYTTLGTTKKCKTNPIPFYVDLYKKNDDLRRIVERLEILVWTLYNQVEQEEMNLFEQIAPEIGMPSASASN